MSIESDSDLVKQIVDRFPEQDQVCCVLFEFMHSDACVWYYANQRRRADALVAKRRSNFVWKQLKALANKHSVDYTGWKNQIKEEVRFTYMDYF